VKTQALFFPFDVFGSGGAAHGAELLADALREILADNRRERVPTRARSYQGKIHVQEFSFATMAALAQWRPLGRRTVRQVLRRKEFLLWATGNHLGVLPVYDELSGEDSDTVVIQLDAHLDVYNLSDCASELSHGNFLLHAAGPLPQIINVGARELLLPPEHTHKYYTQIWAADRLAHDPASVYSGVAEACRNARRVFLDLDCDVFDPAFFPAVTHALPFGIEPRQILPLLDIVGWNRLAGVMLSEFDPARDRNDLSLATLVWFLEYLLLRRYEKPQ
jgi:arginase family enzyme